MLKELKWPTLQQRRTNAKMVMMYRIVHHHLTLLAIYSMFGLLKGSMSFDDSVFWRMVFEIFGHGLLLFWWLQV
jgi:hypothetical protein